MKILAFTPETREIGLNNAKWASIMGPTVKTRKAIRDGLALSASAAEYLYRFDQPSFRLAMAAARRGKNETVRDYVTGAGVPANTIIVGVIKMAKRELSERGIDTVELDWLLDRIKAQVTS